MGEALKFTIEDQAIAELFGRTNFSTKESALLELVKNSYDAGAFNCIINITEKSLQIIDDGKGMDIEDIKKKWMHVGKSDKSYEEENRVLAGSKGVGRFALARLGNFITVTTKKKMKQCVTWSTDWNQNQVELIQNSLENGTIIEITSLRDKWKKKDISNLIDFFNRTYNDNTMKLKISYVDSKDEQTNKLIVPVFSDLKMGENYVNKVTIFYDSDRLKLYVEIESDEFKNEVKSLVNEDINYNFKTIDLKKEFFSELEKDNMSVETLQRLGDFVGVFYFSLDRRSLDVTEKYLYKHEIVTDRITTGIILYRNSFSISSLEGKKDWLGLGARARKSPAAASHPNGRWRVRQNQFSGEVHIDKKNNNKLVDLANRQGLDENEYYETFIKIIDVGIDSFEDFRQKIVRKISAFRKEEPKDEKKIEYFLKSPTSVKNMEDKDIEQLAIEVKNVQERIEKNKKEADIIEKQYKYDARILNLLATQGLKANGIAHELHTDRNYLDQGYLKVIKVLEKLGFWEVLNSEENTAIAARNVPMILNELEKINKKLKVFLDSMLGQIEKRKFKEEISSLEAVFAKLKRDWNRDYDWVDIEIIGNENKTTSFLLTSDILSVIFDNLILNSIQQNSKEEKLEIKIRYQLVNKLIYFKYNDNGTGLSEKYKDDPFRIVKVHESSREDGHGLGMWLVNKTIESVKGKITDIRSDSGFITEFYIEGVEE